jgi:two-component system NtrC family response regulator
VKLPALRERSSDIPLLAKAFLRKFGKQQNRSSLDFSAKSVRAIQCHHWPGNVRELENRIKRAVIMAEGRYVTPTDLELEDSSTNKHTTLKEAREAAEREVVLSAMQRGGGKISRAAEELGISRPTLYELLEKLGIAREVADDKES